MSRREIIVVIVIVNIALLAILMITAQRLDDVPADSVTVSLPAPPVAMVEAKATPIPLPAPVVVSEVAIDEVDNVLRDFAVAAAQSKPLPIPLSTAPSPVEGSTQEVVVKRGDFLEKIARQHGTTIEALKQINNLTTDHLKIGQVLRLPSSTSETAASTTPASTKVASSTSSTSSTSAESHLYRIKSGDNPWKIAKQLHISVEELLRLNGLDEESARNLKPGDMIRVP